MGLPEVTCEACGERSAAIAVRCQSCGALLRPAVPPRPVDPFADLVLDAEPAPAGGEAAPAASDPPPGGGEPAARRRRWARPAVDVAASGGGSRAAIAVLAVTAVLSLGIVVGAIAAGGGVPSKPVRRPRADTAPAPTAVPSRAEAAPPLAPREPVVADAGAAQAVAAAPPAVEAPGPASLPPRERADRTRATPPRAPARAAAADDAVKVGSFSMVDLGASTKAPLPSEVLAPASPPVGRASARSEAAADEAPRVATEGFRKPRLVEPRCVQKSVRLPRGVAASGAVTLKFAVAADGSVGLFEVLGEAPDRRVADALWTAVRACRFVPGLDPQGRPTRLWLTIPVRLDGV